MSNLKERSARGRVPVLDNLRVAAPCDEPWDSMIGDDRQRHCTRCKQSVYNLSEMTREEAEALLLDTHGELCVRYYQRADGTIVTTDCPVGVSRRSRRRILAVSAAAMAAGSIAANSLLAPASEPSPSQASVAPTAIHESHAVATTSSPARDPLANQPGGQLDLLRQRQRERDERIHEHGRVNQGKPSLRARPRISKACLENPFEKDCK